MSVLMYNDVCISQIYFDKKPYRKIKHFDIDKNVLEKSVYYIDISYKRKPLYIQIPRFPLETVDISNNCLTLLINKSFYDNFILNLENYVVQSVYKNSEKWFCGKRFTMNKIVKCMVSIVDKLSEDTYRLTINLGKNVKIYDKYKNSLELSDLQVNKMIETVCVLLVENLQFIDNMFVINVTLEQMKVYLDNRLVEYSIIDSESEAESVSNTYTHNDTSLQSENETQRSKNIENQTCESTESILEDEYYMENKVTHNFF